MDICKAIESVKELKCGFELISLKNGKKAVVTIPMQMSNTTNQLIELANENKGFITSLQAIEKLNITENVFQTAINSLIENGIVWIDEQNFIKKQSVEEKIIYWFPGLLKEK